VIFKGGVLTLSLVYKRRGVLLSFLVFKEGSTFKICYFVKIFKRKGEEGSDPWNPPPPSGSANVTNK
jgi:hypothetical protein